MSKRDCNAPKPDYKYDSVLVSQFINHIMRKGKKAVASKIVYGAFEIVREKVEEDPLDVFKRTIAAVAPSVEVEHRRIGGGTYPIPVEINYKRSRSLVMRWFVKVSAKRSGKCMSHKLAAEIIDANSGKGGVVKMRDDLHRMAESNRAFAHFRR